MNVCVPEVMASLNGMTLNENTMLEINPEEIAIQVSDKIQEMSTFELFMNVSFMGGEYPGGKIALKEDLLKPFCLGGNLNEYPFISDRDNLYRPKCIVVEKHLKQVAIILNGIAANINKNLKPEPEILFDADMKIFLRDHYRERYNLSVREANNARLEREIEDEIVTMSYDDKKEMLEKIKDFKKEKAEAVEAIEPPAKRTKTE